MKEEKNDLFSCGQCSSSFVTKRTLESHMKAFHPLPKVSPKDTDTPDQSPSHHQILSKVEQPRFTCQHCNVGFGQQDELNLHLRSAHSDVTITLEGLKTKPPKHRILKRPFNLKAEENDEIKTKIKSKAGLEAEQILQDETIKQKVLPRPFHPLSNEGNFEITEVVKSLLISHMNAESEREAKEKAAAIKESAKRPKTNVKNASISMPSKMRPTKSESDDEDDEFEGESESSVSNPNENGVLSYALSPSVDIVEDNYGTFMCCECRAEFPTDHQLEIHMRGHVSRPHKCNICGSGFARREHLTKHQTSVHSGVKFTCNFCGKDLSRRDHLLRHIRQIHRHHVKDLDLGSSLQVTAVGPSDIKALELNLTVQRSLQPVKKKLYNNKCDMCSETFTVLESLFHHQRKAHGDIRKYDCAFCSKSFKRNEHLQKHIILHTGERNFCCDHCNKRFHRRDALQDHIRRIHVNPMSITIKETENRENGNGIKSKVGNSRITGSVDINIKKLPPIPGLLPLRFEDFQFIPTVGKN